jgi:hypothetical protein
MNESDSRELLSALLDREPVDAGALATILEDREARALLVDFVRMRSAFAEPAAVPQLTPRAAARSRTVARMAFQIAAALLLVTLGAFVGRRLAASDPDAPPEPTRVVKLEAVPEAGRGPR